MRKISTKHLDALWRDVIRIMFGNKCAKCGCEGHDCHHIIMRSFKAHRWHPLNGVLLCWKCHEDAHRRPIEFLEWIRVNLEQSHKHYIERNTSGFDPKDRDYIKKQLKALLYILGGSSGHASMTFLPLIPFIAWIIFALGILYFRLTS